MKTIPCVTLILLCTIASTAFSQSNDAGLWENICLDKKIARRLNLHFNQEARINQNISRFYYIYGDVGLTYRLHKNIDLMLDYVLIEKRRPDDFWSMRHQAYFALILRKKIWRFRISDRIMPQVQFTDVYSSDKGKIPNYHFRNKLTIKYNNDSRFTYYIASEIYYKINPSYHNSSSRKKELDRMRYFAGMFYELNKKNEIELYYLYENNFHANNTTNNYVVGIGFEHKF